MRASPSGDPGENKQNIAYHYDVSNAFYALWLDDEMVYTCAYCTDWNNDIDRMQQHRHCHSSAWRRRPGSALPASTGGLEIRDQYGP
jgi:cyclopropane-fatty-acyl-phospholipid synthase